MCKVYHKSTNLVNVEDRNQTQNLWHQTQCISSLSFKSPKDKYNNECTQNRWTHGKSYLVNKWAEPFPNLLISVVDKSNSLNLCQHKIYIDGQISQFI